MEVQSPALEAQAQPAPLTACPWASLLAPLQEEKVEPVTSSDVADVLLILARRRKWIFKLTASATLAAVIVVLLVPNTYTATASILPPQQSQSSLTTMLGQMGSLAALGAKELGLKNPSDIYLAMLRSRSVANAIVMRFDLRSVYREKKNFDARKKLARRSEIVSTKEGTISISVSDRDARRSAALANAYVEELGNLTRRLALSEAGQRRMFFQKQIDDEKQALSAAELAFQATQERTGMLVLDAQGKAIIEAVAQTRAQIATREVSLRTMSSFSTEQNPELIRQKEQLAALRQQLAKLEHTAGLGKGNIQVPTGKLPEVEIEYLRAMRELKYHEALFEFLSKQLEAARIDEAKDSVLVQVVDSAVVPERRSGPMRTLPVALITVFTLMGASVWVLLQERVRVMRRDPLAAEKIAGLREELRW